MMGLWVVGDDCLVYDQSSYRQGERIMIKFHGYMRPQRYHPYLGKSRTSWIEVACWLCVGFGFGVLAVVGWSAMR